ncbi:MAG: NHLP bacteriocin system secretion protein, partial [Gammaproteobacteria bacterium]
IGTLNQPDLAQELDQERVRLAEARAQVLLKGDALEQRLELERESITRKRELLTERIESLGRIAEAQKTRNAGYLAQQSKNLAEARTTQKNLGEALAERYESYERLRSEGLSSDDSVLAARQRYMDNQVQRSELDLRAQELELRRLENEQAYQESLDRIEEFRNQLQELEIRERELDQQALETTASSQQRIQEIERNIARLESQLATRSQVVSEHAGRILEITTGPGQIVNAGQRIGAIETEDAEGELRGVAFFAVGDGKKLIEGGVLRLTPATVERERYGSILATITSVSAFPVTADAISSMIGNSEVAQEITQGRSVIQVVARLHEDATALTGYEWTSGKGPEGPLTAGTTASARATVEYRRPITFVIPILRRWTGVG